MYYRVALGVLLLLVAASASWAVRDLDAVKANPGAAWLVRRVGPEKARIYLLLLAVFIVLLGITTIVFAINGTIG